jgi:hypothetical protein
VPGAIVVLALLLCHYNSCCDCAKCLCLKSFNFNSFSTLSDKLIEDNTIAFWTFFLVASHCIGLVNNVISDFVWYGFRNNTIFIELEKEMVNNESPALNLYVKTLMITAIPCIIYNLAYDFFPIFHILTLAIIAYVPTLYDTDENILKSYYISYEIVKEKYNFNNISNLEAQIAFLRNSIIPLTLLVVLCGTENVFLRLAPSIAFAAFFLHQQKLYFHVYELCHIIDLKNMKLKLMVLAKKKADDNKTDIVSLFSQNLKDANCAEMCYGELDGIGVGVISLEDIADASCDTIKEKIEIFKNARALVVICREGENDLYDKIKKYAKTSFFDLKEIVFEDEEANSVDRVESIIKKFFK